jgi:hypothetical protein
MSKPLSQQKLTELRALLGPPPVLRTENQEHYEKIFAQLAEVWQPRDFMEVILLKEFAEAIWLLIRYKRHQTLLIERRYRQKLEVQAQRTKLAQARRRLADRVMAEQTKSTPADIAEAEALEDKIGDSVRDVDEILERTPSELEHNRAFEEAIESHEALERFIVRATARYNNALEQFEHYREGLGQQLHRAAEEIIEADYREVKTPLPQSETPPLVPPSLNANEATPDDSDQSRQ